jgi:release factor glutamine methyltransferase
LPASNNNACPTLPRLQDMLAEAASRLKACSASPRLDGEVLLSHSLGKPRSFLLAWPDHRPEPGQVERFEALLQRRLHGEPLAYLTGEREFWSLPLRVTSATLIPRPETEHLVEQALARIAADADLHIADLGTGSGAIAIAIAHERPRCRVTAVDCCPDALAVARENANNHGLDNIDFRHGDWLQGMTTSFDVIVANPPYIRDDDPHLQADGLPFEPQTALVAGDDGLAAIRVISEQARRHLQDGGWLLFEHGYDQQAAVSDLLRQAGYTAIEGLRDLEGNERIVAAQWSPA